MRLLSTLGVAALLTARVAHAAPPTAEVRALVEPIATQPDLANPDAALAPGAVVVGPRGALSHTLDKRFDALYGFPDRPAVALALHALDVAGDGDSAYFHGTIDVKVDGVAQDAMRVAGIAQHTAAGWKLGAIMFASPLADATSYAHAPQVKLPTAPALTGDRAATYAGWIDHGQLASHRDPNALAVAGTQAGELRTGKDIAAMATAFDKVGLRAASVDVHPVGALAFVTVHATMPVKSKGPRLIEIAAVAVVSGDHWLTLDFTPTTGNFEGQIPFGSLLSGDDLTIVYAAEGPFKDLADYCTKRRCTHKPRRDATLAKTSGPFLAAAVNAEELQGPLCHLMLSTAAGMFVGPQVDCDQALDAVTVKDGWLLATYKATSTTDKTVTTVERAHACSLSPKQVPACFEAGFPLSARAVTGGVTTGGAVTVTLSADHTIDVEGNPRALRVGDFDPRPLLLNRGKHAIRFHD